MKHPCCSTVLPASRCAPVMQPGTCDLQGSKCVGIHPCFVVSATQACDEPSTPLYPQPNFSGCATWRCHLRPPNPARQYLKAFEPGRTFRRCTNWGYQAGRRTHPGSDASSSSISCALEHRYLVPSSSLACKNTKGVDRNERGMKGERQMKRKRCQVADPLQVNICWQAASALRVYQHACQVRGMHESQGGCRLGQGTTFACVHTFVAASDMRPAGTHNRSTRAEADGTAQGCLRCG
jgi:hypothetical protein